MSVESMKFLLYSNRLLSEALKSTSTSAAAAAGRRARSPAASEWISGFMDATLADCGPIFQPRGMPQETLDPFTRAL